MPNLGKKRMDEKTYTRIKEDLDNGKSHKEIIEYYGLCENTVIRVMRAKTFEEYRANNTERINKYKKKIQEKAIEQITMEQITDDKPKDLMGELYRHNQVMEAIRSAGNTTSKSIGTLVECQQDLFQEFIEHLKHMDRGIKLLDEKINMMLEEWDLKGPSERQP